MARTDEADWWFAAVYGAVQEIPYGRVTSYGHIARLLGRRKVNPIYREDGVSCPRQVGICLKHLPSDPSLHFNHDNVPWQRVINAKGIISPRGPSGATRQAGALRQEGVNVGRGSLGELTVDFGVYGWFPSLLPSEEAVTSDSEPDNQNDEDRF